MSDRVRKRIIFYGNVQGVGFRYRALHAANSLGITGWVRNEWDGSVSMEVQGTEADIDQMILMIQRGTYVMIRDMKVKSLPLEKEGIFRIR
ncbi:acylphosphatase [Fusibacillus kribbianus]|uniref:acylphosphatase n=1 Tax=Fusibacillus kribbianus TaxID=3044208 RepID=A0AAP4EY40_9FIRM|nr:acylphosphatase [Ruminococcus sp. YH-rum2234]MDI9243144.1 acylphosphatase [Ruminococcus sp. YH-rum2234]